MLLRWSALGLDRYAITGCSLRLCLGTSAAGVLGRGTLSCRLQEFHWSEALRNTSVTNQATYGKICARSSHVFETS